MFAPAPAASAVASGASKPDSSVPVAGNQTGVPSGAVGASDVKQELITVQTDLYKAVFNSRGGDLVHLELLRYKDQDQPEKPVVLFDESSSRLYVAQTGLIGGSDYPNHKQVMTVVPGIRELAPGASSLSLSFQFSNSAGVKYVKTFTFKRDSYQIGVQHQIVNGSSQAIDPQLYLQLVRDGNVEEGSMLLGTHTFTGPAVYTELEKYHKIDFKDIDKKKAEVPSSSADGWVAMVQHYFASAWLVPERFKREFFIRESGVNQYAVGLIVPLGEIKAGNMKDVSSILFAGPQEEKKLEALAPGLELLKDYGIFALISKPLFWLLDKLHGFIGNWGWSIVSLVLLLKICFYWLNANAYRSMAKMKAVAPKMEKLKEKYKDQPQQLQQEVIKLYREEKVNPAGGCLPILVQIPVFISLYWVLLSSVEMRNAPWIGWVHDLSVRDPLFILPALMTLSTLVQTWLNPKPADPTQAKMMWIMPMMFSVMFFFFPAGLVLYWLTNNILTIAQQWFINQQIEKQQKGTAVKFKEKKK